MGALSKTDFEQSLSFRRSPELTVSAKCGTESRPMSITVYPTNAAMFIALQRGFPQHQGENVVSALHLEFTLWLPSIDGKYLYGIPWYV